MFEAHVLNLLRKYLGDYVRGLSIEALKISVWKGDVVLKDLQLKAEALNALKLPITVKAGFLGSVTLKVPWNKLGKEAVIVLLDRIFLLAEPLQDASSSKQEDEEKWFEAKRRLVEDAEFKWSEGKDKGAGTTEDLAEGSSWLGSLIKTIVGNLKISITNLHIRYEDTVSNPLHPFSAGITLATLAAVTIDEAGVETFVTSGALEKLCKALQLQRLALYHDSDSKPWKPTKKWEDMTPQEWNEIFEEGINQNLQEGLSQSKWSRSRQYLLHPVDGMMRYYRRNKREKRDPDTSLQELSLVLDQVEITVSELQYCDGMKLLEGFSQYRRRLQFAHFRPHTPVSSACRAWWWYAVHAVLQQQRKIKYRFSWSKIAYCCQLRRKYIQLYASCLQQSLKVDNTEIRSWDKELDVKVILEWRKLAHNQVDSTRFKEAAKEREQVRRSGWWPLAWGSAEKASSTSSSGAVEMESSGSGQSIEEELKSLNALMNYKPEEEASQEAPNMLQITCLMRVQKSAARIMDRRKFEILCGTFENLQVGLKMFPKTVHCDLQLQFYGLSAPEGPLLESVSPEGREYALTTTFVHSPLEEHLDWKLYATMSPIHITVWRASFDRFLCFLRSARAVSPDVVLETAAALQSKFEEVTRKAQEQLQLVLEESSRFSICLDLDAPKITIPGETLASSAQKTQLLVDLGHFKLHTAEVNLDGKDGNKMVDEGRLYSRFHIVGRDISAFLADGLFDWSEVPSNLIGNADMEFDGIGYVGRQIFPVLDRCGVSVVFDQIQAQHPSYASTRMAIQVPHVGLHFSPARYERLLCLLSAITGADPQSQFYGGQAVTEVSASWHPGDHCSEIRVLLWGGIGSTVAEWQPRWAALAGPYLFILELDMAQTYQRCFSVVGKQVVEIPPALIGGSEHVIAVCNRGSDLQKVIESSNAVVMQLRTEETKAAWLNHLNLATYKTAASESLSLPKSVSGEINESKALPINPSEQLNLFVVGSLDEFQLFISGSTEYINLGPPSEERLIAELQAYGGKVDVLQRQHDMTINIKLHSLKILDKLQGHVSSSCQFIARSVLSCETLAACDEEVFMEEEPQLGTGVKHGSQLAANMADDDDEYFRDALADFGGASPDSHVSSPRSSYSHPKSLVKGSSRLDLEPSSSFISFWSHDSESLLKAEALLDQSADVMDESEAPDFVRIRICFRDSSSAEYDGTDTQISIRVATLDFFCNRPTVVTLIEFGSVLSDLSNIIGEPLQEKRELTVENGSQTDTVGTRGRDIVKGLLGRGKSRVVFRLQMYMERARIFLNKEDGSLLAMLAQEKFEMDLKVYPASFTIAGALGNWRVCDMLLGPDHQWGWFCDIRDPNCVSLVELEFQSFNRDDEDYQGFDYSLSGKLSAVRIVFLYRFIQEITVYFGALSTPQVQQMITIGDEVGSIGRLIQLDGLPAVKLQVGLDTPVIIMPRSSTSREFMQVDLGHLEVFNSFEWYGGSKEDPSAVHMDVLHAEMTSINMVVGINGVPGKDMVQEARGLQVKVRRPLRDLLRKVPEVQVDVQVDKLSGIMSDKEYLVITDCAATNIAEVANLPPSFREEVGANESTKMELGDSGNEFINNGQQDKSPMTSWTTLRVTVDVQHVELELYTGLERESPLARVEMQGFWLGYCSTSTQDMDVYLTLPNFSVIDLRPDTKPEMRLMLGSMADVEDSSTPSEPMDLDPMVRGYMPSESGTPRITMLVMDVRIKPTSQAVVIRLQRPRLLVVVDFLLAVGQFLVPSLGVITGQDEKAHDPIIKSEHVRLETPIYEQDDENMCLSSEKQLIVDAHDIDEFVYDGRGHSLWLYAKHHAVDKTRAEIEHLIVIGCRKKLRFKNVTIKNGYLLPEIVHLSTDSSYTAAPEDAVVLECFSTASESLKPVGDDNEDSKKLDEDSHTSNNVYFMLDVQAVAPELTFYDSTKWPTGDLTRREKLLRAKMDLNFMFASKGKDRWIRGIVKGLSFEGGSGLLVVDPLDVQAEYSCAEEKTSILVSASDICIRLSFSVMRLILRFQEDALLRFNFGGDQVVSRCTHFDRIWVNESGDNLVQQVAIWRPRAPQGYVILNDCATSGVAPPSQAVMAISNKFGRVKKPLGFELIWCSHEVNNMGGDETSGEGDLNICSIWMPVAPHGYVALGCVAERGRQPPLNTVVYCVHKALVTSASVSDCIFYVPPQNNGAHSHGSSIWRIENAVGSFFAHHSVDIPSNAFMCDLREVVRQSTGITVYETDRVGTNNGQVQLHPGKVKLDRKPSGSRTESSGTGYPNPGKIYMTTAQLDRIWWNKGTDSGQAASVWRPVTPLGYAIVGDCLMDRLEPPSFGIIVRDDPDRFARPVKYLPRMHASGKGVEDAFMWFPVAPPGYVAMGCVTTKTHEKPSLDAVRCVHMNLVNQTNLSTKPSFTMHSRGYSCSLWSVKNQANTFIARPDLKKPPVRMAYALAETSRRKVRDNLSAEVKVGRLSTTIFNDLSGLMTPLVNSTMTSTTLAANGRAKAFNAVVISTFAASTFNTQLEAWEPLIEPFEGIFKYESYDADSEALRSGKQVRVTATSVVNLNVTSAGLDTAIGAITAWRKQASLEQQARLAAELEANDYRDYSASTVSSALQDDDLEKLVIENKLGCDLYLKTSVDNFGTAQPLSAGNSIVVRMPPLRFPNKLISVEDPKQPRQFVAVHVSEVKDLRIKDDGNGQDYLCALRLAVRKQTPEQQKGLIPQSARSRCVKPCSLTQGPDSLLASAKWNEVFVFEVPKQGSANLEIVVTNQAARAGKGGALGVISLPVEDERGHDLATPSSLWNVVKHAIKQGSSSSWPSAVRKSYNLLPPKMAQDSSEVSCGGIIVVSMYFFTAKSDWQSQGKKTDEELGNPDIGLLFALAHDGPWVTMRSLFSLGTIPKQINDKQLVVEVSTAKGHKHVYFRSLAVFFNNTDMSLEVAVCPSSRLNSPDGPTSSSLMKADVRTEEIFENQRYQPVLGWGSRWPGNFLPNDPGHWSNRDSSKSNQEFPDIQPAPGWFWTSDWTLDKSGNVDNEGWAYGADFQSIRWPPPSPKCSKKATFDFVRRRRMYRMLQQRIPVGGRQVVGTVQPGSVISIPLSCLGPKSDLCVQVRPESNFSWGRTVQNVNSTSSGQASHDTGSSGITKSPSTSGLPASFFSLAQLKKTEELILCQGTPKHTWLEMDADPTLLYDDLNVPLYDWKLRVNAPLKIENRLPCTADYVIWEQPADGSVIQRQRGVVSSGSSVYVYSVDMRRAVYLTWRAQGGWRPEQDTVLISDPTAEELPTGFWMIHQRSERKLRVSIEHDLGATRTAARIIRIFVPYWLRNDASLPLTYRLVEIEPNEHSGGDSSWLTKAAKAAKQAGRRPAHAVNSSSSQLRKVVRCLEALEDSSGLPAMLSLRALSDRYRSLGPSSQDNMLSPRLGMSVAVMGSDFFRDAISFKSFEDNMERIDLDAVDDSGSYYRLSAFLDMSAERTKVVHLQPHTLFANRLGQRLRIRQRNLGHEELFYPNDQPKTIMWQSIWEVRLISICMEGYRWSEPFSVDAEGIMHVTLQSEMDNSHFIVRAEVRNGLKESRFLVIFRHASFQTPYRVENLSSILSICFRQEGSDDNTWHRLLPGSSEGFAWADLNRSKLLEIKIHGADDVSSQKYSIDRVGDYGLTVGSGPSEALHVTVFREGLLQVVSVADWKIGNEDLAIIPYGLTATIPRSTDLYNNIGAGDDTENQFRMIIELAEFGLSVVDYTPEELIYFSMQNLIFSYATGLGSNISRFKLRVDGLQVDNQLALTPMPVLIIPQDSMNRSDFLLKCTLTIQDHGQVDQYVYPYIGVQGAPGVAFLVNIHEPILWRFYEMFKRLDVGSLTSSQTTDVAIDPIIRIGLLNTSEIRFKVTLAMSPTQRPRGMLGFWSTLIASLGNTNEMPIRLTPHVQEDVCMRQSALLAAAVASIRNDVLSQPLMLLTGVDLLGNASSALGHMSKGVAALSMDKKFMRSRQKQESKGNVEDIGDGLREGGEALVKGVFRGVTGIFTKPVEGARSLSVEGFVQGVGKGLIGAVAQPMSGVLDFLSKTTEGANATRMKLAAALTLQEQLFRQRLPRVIGGDNILRPYDEYKARGQVLMQLAERGAVFGNIDLFKVRGKYAASDAYEFHYNLPKGKTLMITHRRVILLQHPTTIISPKRSDLMKEPCTIVWDVTWNDLMTLELEHGKDEPPNSPPCRLVIHLRDWSQERILKSKEIARVVKCHPGTSQAAEIQAAIQQAYSTYGPEPSSGSSQPRARSISVKKPYSGAGAGAASGAALGLLAGPAAPIAVPVMATFGALIGTAGQAMLLDKVEEMPLYHEVKYSRLTEGTQSVPNGSPSVCGDFVQKVKFVTKFQRIWWDKGAPWSKKYHVSIWRPVPPAGYVSVGDVVQGSYNPPEKAMVYLEEEGVFVPPEGFDLVWRDTESGARDPVTIWKPRPSTGYVAIGCVVVPDYCEPDRRAVCCVRRDRVVNVGLGQEPLWRDYKGSALWHCSLWKVQNEAQTFLARRDHQSPSPDEAFSVVI